MSTTACFVRNNYRPVYGILDVLDHRGTPSLDSPLVGTRVAQMPLAARLANIALGTRTACVPMSVGKLDC